MSPHLQSPETDVSGDWWRFYSPFDSRLCWLGLLCVFFFFLHLASSEQNKRPAARTVKVRRYLTRRGIPLLYQAKVMVFLCGGKKKITARLSRCPAAPSSPRLDQTAYRPLALEAGSERCRLGASKTGSFTVTVKRCPGGFLLWNRSMQFLVIMGRPLPGR